jgi:hypothetical protein
MKINPWSGMLWMSSSIFLLIGGMWFMWRVINSPAPDIVGYEQNVIIAIQQMLDGKALYSNPEEVPFNIVQYTPLYTIMVKILAEALKIQSSDLPQLQELARSVSSFFALLTASLPGYLVYRSSKHWLIAFSAGVLALLLPMPWAFNARPDAMLYCFTLLSIVLFVHYSSEQNQRGLGFLFMAGFSLSLALLSKQTALVHIAMMLVFPFYHQQIRDRAVLILGVVLGLFVPSLLFSSYYSLIPAPDNYFYAHIIGGVQNGWSFYAAIASVYHPYLLHYTVFLILSLYAIFGILRELKKALAKPDSSYKGLRGIWNFFHNYERFYLVLAYFFLTFTVYGLVSGLKYRSSINYMSESNMIALAFIIHSFVRQDIRANLEKGLVSVMGAIFFLGISGLMFYKTELEYGYRLNITEAEVYEQGLISALEAELRDYPDAYFISLLDERVLNMLFHEQAIFSQLEIYSISPFDFSRLQSLIESGELRYLVLESSRQLPPYLWAESSTASFESSIDLGDYHIYVNRNNQDRDGQ